MRIFTVLTFYFLPLLGIVSQQTVENDFYSELGTAKTQSFKALLSSYEEFLKLNYPEETSFNQKTSKLLAQILEGHTPFKYDSLSAIRVLKKLEDSGLRKDIFLYKNEVYGKDYNIEQFFTNGESPKIDLGNLEDSFEELVTVDNKDLSEEQILRNEKRRLEFDNFLETRPYTNQNGLFLFALSKVTKVDSSLHGYCGSKYAGLDFSPTLIANGYVNHLSASDFSEWKNKIPLVIEFYLYNILIKYGEGKGS